MIRELALLVAAGLLGPILSALRRGQIPVVVGELAAGALIGNTGLRLVDPHASIFPVFYTLGFAMLMLTAGTHVDVRSSVIRRGAARGAMTLAVVFLLSVPLGFAIGIGLGIGHEWLLVVLLAGSSAAVAFPILEERHATGPAVALITAWIAMADSITVVLMPLGLGGSSQLWTTLAGDALVIVVGVAILVVALLAARRAGRLVERTYQQSRSKGWALQLRLSVLLLLLLVGIAEGTGASILVAGFLAGMILIRLGQPDRLMLQISGVANGFFVPIFFVLLGAELDLRALFADPRAIAFAIAMAVGAVVVHVGASAVAGRERRLASGLAASAQLGLPAAAAGLAIATHSLAPATTAALVAGGLLTLAPATFGASRLAKS